MNKTIIFILAGLMVVSMFGYFAIAATSQVTTATVTVSSFLSVTIDDSELEFGPLDPDTVNNKPLLDPLTATIGAETNVVAKINTEANAASFACTGGGCGSNTIAISNLQWSASDFAGADYTETAAEVCNSLGASSTCNIFHELDIPAAQAAGAYSLGITITATV